ncbi:SDR family NAD(P)-dependent oxidoreductase [Pseudonocardia sp. ICBG1034]|uniref:SDR family NAD(P)-dependent oxidoreductase n=1 Tax=Pseudonocardia sp. ICBG1034 TaxID=2844381 RepID=UPI001CC9511D|nr:SDR family oxidoreductase [Pseudonocardia sp. ICBG1034]
MRARVRHGGREVIGVDLAGADVTCDVAAPDAVARVLDTVGALDAIVHVAGIQRAAPVEKEAVTDWDRQIAVNVRSGFLLAKYGAAVLDVAPAPAIVLVASVAGLRGTAKVYGYSASKGAVHALTRSLARERAPRGIRVNSLSPGWTDIAFNGPIIAELGGGDERDALVRANVPLGMPDELAAAAVLLAGPASSYITGQDSSSTAACRARRLT